MPHAQLDGVNNIIRKRRSAYFYCLALKHLVSIPSSSRISQEPEQELQKGAGGLLARGSEPRVSLAPTKVEWSPPFSLINISSVSRATLSPLALHVTGQIRWRNKQAEQ